MNVSRLARLEGFLLMTAAFLGMAASAGGQKFRTEAIFDPVLNMKAYDVTIPEGWKYQGTLQPGNSCDETPSPVFRSYSQDGLSEFRRMPRFDWSWSNAPYAPKPKGDCLPLTRDVTAVEFLHLLAKFQRAVSYSDMALDPKFAQAFRQNLDADNAAIQARAGQRPFRGDAAAARIEFQNGSFTIEEQLRVSIRCSHMDLASLNNGGPKLFRETCGATVRVIRAPKGKLDALVQLLDANRVGTAEDAHWTQAYNAKRQAQTNAVVGSIHATMNAQQRQYEQAQAVRARQNQEFQAGLQAGYDRHNATEAANMNARHTPASDWVDYALDQQTVSGTGGTVKVPAGYSQVWSNANGQYFETNNLNTNPNGVLPGTWTPQTQVHGNGQAY